MFNYIDLSAVNQESKTISASTEIEAANAPSRARQIVRTDDILVSTVRPNLNAVARVPQRFDGATASTGFCVLRPSRAKVDPGYIFHWVRSPKFVSDMVRNATGASYPAVSDRIIKNSVFQFPPLDEQRRIAAILDKADALHQKRKRAISLLDSLTQSIFYEMFGDVETNERLWPDGVRLDEVATVGSGITKGRPDRGAVVRDVPYMAVVNVQERALDLSVVKTILASDLEIAKFRLKYNDLLLTEGGDPDKLGRGTLWRDELPEAIHQNHIFKVRFTANDIEPLFANWLIGSARGKRYFLQSAKQTTGIASINKTQLSSFPMLMPPLYLQTSFAHRAGVVQRQRDIAVSAALAVDHLFASLQHRAFAGQL